MRPRKVGRMSDEKIYYVHYHTGYGSMTFALREAEREGQADDLRTFEVGMAFCSPEDQFSKPRGRCIARGRLGRLETVVRRDRPVRDALYLVCNWAVEFLGRTQAQMEDASRAPRWFPRFVMEWGRVLASKEQ